MTEAPTPQQTAEAVATHMVERDAMVRSLGITVESVGPGSAVLRMTVDDTMLNSHGMAHGGLLFILADAAFAYACNAHGRVAVATGCAITFVTAAAAGDVLTARAAEVSLRGRNGVYDVAVTNRDGDMVALFRGNSLQMKETVLPA